jgi:uncharacterized protein YkwD
MNIKKSFAVTFFISIVLLLAANGCKITPDLSTGEVEQSVFREVNKYRLSIQLGQLTWNNTIAQQCREHSENMAAGIVEVGHDGYQDRFEKIRAAIADAVTFGENVAYISGHPAPGEYALELWLNNPAHRGNIEGKFNLTGVGVASKGSGGYYITQIFIKTK